MPFAPTYEHRKLVPMQYHRTSGLLDACFHVRRAWHAPYRFMRHPRGGAMPIAEAAFCSLHTASHDQLCVLVDVASFPQLAEAALLLGKTYFTGNRVQRYVTLFKAYECLERTPDITLSAVRHGLSHAPTALSRPKTVNALQTLFGTTTINLDLPAHRRVFYFQLVKLLLAVDSLLTAALLVSLPSLRLVESEDTPLHEWRLNGMAGIYPPIQINEEAI